MIKLPKKSGIRYINLEKIKCLVCKEPNPTWEAWLKIMNVKTQDKIEWMPFKLHFCNSHYQDWRNDNIDISMHNQKIAFDTPGWTLLHCNSCNSNKVDYMYKGKFQDLYICKKCSKESPKNLELMILFANSIKDFECDVFAFTGFIADEVLRKDSTDWIEDDKLKHVVKSILVLHKQLDRELSLILGD